eukprot:1177469-Prorocentrum_minimum.AAC.2
MACMVNSTGVMPAGKGRRASEPSESRLLGIVKVMYRTELTILDRTASESLGSGWHQSLQNLDGIRIWMASEPSESGSCQNPQNPQNLDRVRIWIASESGSRQNLASESGSRQNLDRVRIWIASESGSHQNPPSLDRADGEQQQRRGHNAYKAGSGQGYAYVTPIPHRRRAARAKGYTCVTLRPGLEPAGAERRALVVMVSWVWLNSPEGLMIWLNSPEGLIDDMAKFA